MSESTKMVYGAETSQRVGFEQGRALHTVLNMIADHMLEQDSATGGLVFEIDNDRLEAVVTLHRVDKVVTSE